MIFPGACEILCNLALANVSNLPPHHYQEHLLVLFPFLGSRKLKTQGLCTCHFCYLECSSPPASGDWLLLILHASACKSPPQSDSHRWPYLNFPCLIFSTINKLILPWSPDTASSQVGVILPSRTHLAMSGDSFGWEGRASYWHLVGGGQGCC